MKQICSLLFICAFFFACGNGEEKDPGSSTDSMSAKDSIKKSMAEDLPPPTDIRQFNWFYSSFFHAATTDDDSLFNKFIHPVHGLWIIQSSGAVPQFVNVKMISEYKMSNGKRLIPIERSGMAEEPKEADLPVVDCDQKDFYNKTGCFTTVRNVFAEEKIWEYAALTPDQNKQVAQQASTISRIVINTANYKFYFSLIEGGWYISFIDVRKPCQA